MEKDYGNCQHEWKVDYLTPSVPRIKCNECHLSIEVYQGHVSIWDYEVEEGGNPWIGKLFYNKAI